MGNKNIVVVRKGIQDVETVLSLPELIRFCINNNIQFVVCHVDDSEYHKMSEIITKEKYIHEEHFTGNDFLYNHFNYMCTYDFENEILKFVGNNDSNEKEAYELDLSKDVIETSKYPFDKYSTYNYLEDLKIYTTYNTEDLIKYYASHSIVDSLQGKVHEETNTLKNQDIATIRQLIYKSYKNY